MGYLSNNYSDKYLGENFLISEDIHTVEPQPDTE